AADERAAARARRGADPAGPGPALPMDETISDTRTRSHEEIEEASAARAAVPREADDVPEPPRTVEEGTAAGIKESDFHGRAAVPGTKEAARLRTVKGAVRRLLRLATGEFPGSRLINRNNATRIALKTNNGEEVVVRVRMSRVPLAPEPDGL